MQTPFGKLFATFTLLFISFTSQADILASPKKVDQLSDKFIQLVQESDIIEAYKLFAPYVYDKNSFLQTAQKINVDISNIEQRTGASLATSAVATQHIGEDFIKKIYLVKYKTAALVWELTFYQASKGYNLVGINNHTNIDPLFQ